MVKIAIVTGTTRKGRNNLQVAEWLTNYAKENYSDHDFELVDIKEFNLPRFEEDYIPAMKKGQYDIPEVQAWSDKIRTFDGYIFVTPEYNKGIPSGLKDALDHISGELHNKAAGIAAYGGSLGVTSIAALRLILANFKLAVTSTTATFSLNTDFENMSVFKPADYHSASVNTLFEEVIAWSQAMKTLR